MSTSHPIKQLLGVKDKYIQIHNCHEDVYKGKKVMIAETDLIRSFNRCPLPSVKHNHPAHII
ncbi:hypothetical protein [Vagococcus acidifermentans]|uniref:Uncharacterized protein n=1 Tax=Vagococcus acidifermentans TaxID=564710 RepID=A0A430B0V6_9ENTE|nr:hypothetical protein [Vagococcus acidifermentans]RSU13970.1 hypothetical protein CBF27_03460 [Vagococcus acidifermentans]